MPFTSTFTNEDLLDFFSEFGPEISGKEIALDDKRRKHKKADRLGIKNGRGNHSCRCYLR